MKRRDRYRKTGVAVALTLAWLASGVILQAAASNSLPRPLVQQLLDQHAEQSLCIVSTDRESKGLEHPLEILCTLAGNPRTEARIAHLSGANVLLHDTVPLHHLLLLTQVASSDL